MKDVRLITRAAEMVGDNCGRLAFSRATAGRARIVVNWQSSGLDAEKAQVLCEAAPLRRESAILRGDAKRTAPHGLAPVADSGPGLCNSTAEAARMLAAWRISGRCGEAQ